MNFCKIKRSRNLQEDILHYQIKLRYRGYNSVIEDQCGFGGRDIALLSSSYISRRGER
jgi:hypothetical protein